jgi:hypothetical protein
MKKILFFAVVFFVICACAVRQKKDSTYLSREAMLLAVDIVKLNKPTPPEAARFYAMVTSTYYDVLVKTNSQRQAFLASELLIFNLYPDVNSRAEILSYLQSRGIGLFVSDLGDTGRTYVQNMLKRVEEDSKQASLVQLVGEEFWFEDQGGKKPLSPNAGSWKKWIVEDGFSVPPPPAYMSVSYQTALRQVKEAAQNRTPEQERLIKFWSGVPGTETPAGIWLMRHMTETEEYVKTGTLTDREFALRQMVLAQSLADAFIECWKVKFTYWTKRPSVVDSSIVLALPNPAFPAYTSGHSTVSKTAAVVLGYMYPGKQDVFTRDAWEAKNSRLWAGIHFPFDNDAGENLGREIGLRITKSLVKQ